MSNNNKNISIYINQDTVRDLKNRFNNDLGININKSNIFKFGLEILEEYLNDGNINIESKKIKYYEFINRISNNGGEFDDTVNKVFPEMIS